MSRNILVISSLIGIVLNLRLSEASTIDCGTVDSETARTSWPFLVALYNAQQETFFCGGTLISTRNVLTAAHCVQPKNSDKPLAPEDLVVLLGGYHLGFVIETGGQRRVIEKVNVHPDWKASSEEYDADLAILNIRGSVGFSRFVRPICMPDNDPPIGVIGMTSGWGLSDSFGQNVEPFTFKEHATVLSNCHTTQKGFASLSSSQIFCGGSEEEGSADIDSGGGIFVRSGSAWVQFGVVSAAIHNSTSFYTNLKPFRNWINETVADAVNKKTVKIDLECSYKVVDERYTCVVGKTNVTIDYFEVDSFNGTHQAGYTDQNVSTIWFSTGKLYYIPDGIGRKLKYLEILLASNKYQKFGLKQLQRSSLKYMDSLRELIFDGNNIESVDQDALRDLPNLEKFSIAKNQLRMLLKYTFERNIKLTHIDARENQLEYLFEDLFIHNPLLRFVSFEGNNVKSILTDFTHLRSISQIDLRGNDCIDDSLEDAMEEGKDLFAFQTLLTEKCFDFGHRFIFENQKYFEKYEPASDL